jgi:RNA polymerase sigma-70 factor, ECF subfamily
MLIASTRGSVATEGLEPKRCAGGVRRARWPAGALAGGRLGGRAGGGRCEAVEDRAVEEQAAVIQATVPARVDRDSALVTALRCHDGTAAEQLVATYGDRAYRLAMRITGTAPDAEEVVQDAFWRVVRKIDTFRGDSAFGSWLYRIVANAAYEKLRVRRGQRTELPLDEILPGVDEHGRHGERIADWSASLEDPALQTELRVVLTTVIDALPVDYRTAIVLRDVEGLSNPEIGEMLNVSVATVKSRVHRARLFLRKQLATYMSAPRTVEYSA